MMKKLFCMLLALAMLLSLAACGGKDGGGDANGGGNAGTDGGGSEGGGYHEGRPGQAVSTYWFDFTVGEAYACQEFGGYTAKKDEGMRLVVVPLTVKNTQDYKVDMFQTDFQLEWDVEDGVAVALSAGDLDSKEVFPDEYVLDPGGSREGVLVYEVPEMDLYYLTFLEVFDDGSEAGRKGDSFVITLTAEQRQGSDG